VFNFILQFTPEKKNLILAFTNENIHNLKGEIIKRFGYIPEKTSILILDSFCIVILLNPMKNIFYNSLILRLKT